MARETLTARGIGALTTTRPQEDFWDTLVPGFHVRVTPQGRKTYYVRYRQNGKHRRFKIGTHPSWTLADARKRARQIIAAAQAGEDPALERKERRAVDTTFEAMAREALGAKVRTTRTSTQRERERILETELLPKWGGRPAASITRREVVQLAEDIAKRAPIMGNRTLALVNMLYNTALGRGFPTVEANPAHLVKPPGLEEGRERYLERDEIQCLWEALESESPVIRGAFRFALLTAQRIGSVCQVRWADVDESDVWTIPASVFKGKRPHLVPLSREALAVLDDLRPISGDAPYVFPGRSDGTKPHLTTTNRALQRIRARSKLRHWTIHDFRRTFRTHATRAAKPAVEKDPAGLGVAPHVADAVLGHKEVSLGRKRYTGDADRYLLSEKREALRRWGAFVANCLGS